MTYWSTNKNKNYYTVSIIIIIIVWDWEESFSWPIPGGALVGVLVCFVFEIDIEIILVPTMYYYFSPHTWAFLRDWFFAHCNPRFHSMHLLISAATTTDNIRESSRDSINSDWNQSTEEETDKRNYSSLLCICATMRIRTCICEYVQVYVSQAGEGMWFHGVSHEFLVPGQPGRELWAWCKQMQRQISLMSSLLHINCTLRFHHALAQFVQINC